MSLEQDKSAEDIIAQKAKEIAKEDKNHKLAIIELRGFIQGVENQRGEIGTDE